MKTEWAVQFDVECKADEVEKLDAVCNQSYDFSGYGFSCRDFTCIFDSKKEAKTEYKKLKKAIEAAGFKIRFSDVSKYE